jgi:hypothetical protein
MSDEYVSKNNMTNPAAPTTPEPASPDTRQGPTVPQRLAALIQIVRVLLGHGRRFAETAAARAATPQFATINAVFGTHDLTAILARVQRGILRAMALERYLLTKAEKGRDIGDAPPRERAPAVPQQAHQPEPRVQQTRRRRDPDDLTIPTLEELEAEVRRRPIGRTVAAICLDLGVVPGFCTGDFWNQVFETLLFYGGSLTAMLTERIRRHEAFQKERDKRPDTWGWNWQDLSPQIVCQLLGGMIGQTLVVDSPVPS